MWAVITFVMEERPLNVVNSVRSQESGREVHWHVGINFAINNYSWEGAPPVFVS
jgi:hypothetical protein